MTRLKIAVSLAIIALFIFACTQNQAPPTNTSDAANASPTATQTPDELAEGRKHYKEQCARCHKDDGSGGEVVDEGKTLKVEDLRTEKMKKESDEEYIEYMVKGIPDEGMPSFKDILTDEQMKEVVKFIRKEIQK